MAGRAIWPAAGSFRHASPSVMAMTRLRFSPLVALLATCVLLAAALFSIVGTADAQGTQVTCPAGTTLSADGTQCLSDAVNDNVVTTTSCVQGVLSADGTQCIVPRLDAAPSPSGDSGGAITAPVPTFTG